MATRGFRRPYRPPGLDAAQPEQGSGKRRPGTATQSTASPVPKFTIVSYNVLAQSKLKGPHYAYCTGPQLNWHARRKALLSEVLALQADVLCLQEVDHYEEWWRPAMGEAGYDVVFHKRGRRHRDGVATFFLRDKFQLFCSEMVDLNNAGSFLGEAHPSGRLQQDNVATVVALQPWEDSNHPTALCIANAQLVAPKSPDLEVVQRKQLLMLVRTVERFNADFQLPTVLCGSFNMLPEHDHYYMMRHGCMPSKLEPPEAPPERPTVEVISMSQVRLSWVRATRCGDAPVDGFVIRRRVGGHKAMGFGDPVFFAGKDLQSAIVGGLAAGLTYEFIVAANSAVGVGDFSKPSLPVRTKENPAKPPLEHYLKHPTEAGTHTVEVGLETVDDWLRKGPACANVDKHALSRERMQVPLFEDKSLNVLVNPVGSKPRGTRVPKTIHTLELDSAYRSYSELGEPAFTLNSERFRGCADYIFYSSGRLRLAELLNLPEPEAGSALRNLDPRRRERLSDATDTAPPSYDARRTLDTIDYDAGTSVAVRNPDFMGEWQPVASTNAGARHTWFPNDEAPSDHAPLAATFHFDLGRLASGWN